MEKFGFKKNVILRSGDEDNLRGDTSSEIFSTSLAKASNKKLYLEGMCAALQGAELWAGLASKCLGAVSVVLNQTFSWSNQETPWYSDPTSLGNFSLEKPFNVMQTCLALTSGIAFQISYK